MLGAVEGGGLADGGTAPDHCAKKKKKSDLRSVQIQAQRCRDIYPHSAKAFTLTNETDMYTLVIFPLSSLSCFSSFSSRLIGKWRVFGSYLDNSHIFLPGSPLVL